MAQKFSLRVARAIKRRLTKVLPKKVTPIKKTSHRKQHSGPRLSLVVATYNVESYIDRFLASVFGQSSHLKRFEVIIVDDGSTDGTADIVRSWQTRYPDHLRYVHQENAGAGAARNTGLIHARGQWVGFPDPDDFLHVDYFRNMLKETEVAHKKQLLAVVSNLILYREDSDTFTDSHPLRYRFKSGIVRKPSNELGNHMQLATNTVWMKLDAVKKHRIRFDSRVVPSFEDGHFINRLFLAQPEQTVSFVPKALYYYRKRIAQNSLLDGAKSNPSWYGDQIQYGYIDLLLFAQKTIGSVPLYIQRMCLYDVFWRFRHLVDYEERAAYLSDDQKVRFSALIAEVFSYIDTETIENFSLAGCTEEDKVALLAIYKNQRRYSTAVYVHQIDGVAGQVQFSSLSGGNDKIDLRILVNGVDTASVLPSERRRDFMGLPYVRQHYFWVAMEDGDEISFEVDGHSCRIRHGRNALGDRATWLVLRNALQPATNPSNDPETQRLRNHVIANRDRFRGGRVLMDSIEKADDNAEHLYRYMVATGQSDKAWFILSESSPDWPKLEAEGFRLLPFGSDDHIAAQMNAEFFISSHADHYVINPVPRGNFADLTHFKYIFLQHGVMNNDMSRWLNTKPIRLFLTTMPKEFASIVHPDSPYIFTERETLLSGLPRHDRLLSKANQAKADSIVIMPTWRKYLTEEVSVEGTGQLIRGKIDTFPNSDFARNWIDVLTSPRLKYFADKHDLRVTFAPHPNMAMYIDDMDIPDWIETVDARSGISYQDLFARARVAISDYSSAVTEVAFLQRPLIYFQFDAAEMFSGDHVCKKGFFSFQDDGFGPVVETSDAVLDSLEKALNGQEDSVYAARRQDAFPHRDGKCCERVCVAIDKIAERRPRLEN